MDAASILDHGVDTSGRQVIEAPVQRVPIIDGMERGCRLRQGIASRRVLRSLSVCCSHRCQRALHHCAPERIHGLYPLMIDHQVSILRQPLAIFFSGSISVQPRRQASPSRLAQRSAERLRGRTSVRSARRCTRSPLLVPQCLHSRRALVVSDRPWNLTLRASEPLPVRSASSSGCQS